jgi:hypothetical protein
MLSGFIAALVPTSVLARRVVQSRARRVAVIAGVAVVVMVALVAWRYGPQRGNQGTSSTALVIRMELAKASFRMLSSSPTFGIGIGEYAARSGEFIAPDLLKIFPSAIHENAHNNFLQILAELGIVGLAAVLWTLGIAAVWSVKLLRQDLHNPLAWGMVGGVAAFLVSWLGGHPMLIDEPAFTFWILLGAVCGWGAAVAPRPLMPYARWIVAVLALASMVTIGVRVERTRDDFDLEHRGLGLSAWQAALDGVRYRFAGSASSVFVPGDAHVIIVPLRAVKADGDLKVELRLDDHPGDVVNVPFDRWNLLRLVLPSDRRGARFRRLDLHVANGPAASGDAILMIGKVEGR